MLHDMVNPRHGCHNPGRGCHQPLVQSLQNVPHGMAWHAVAKRIDTNEPSLSLELQPLVHPRGAQAWGVS